MQALTMSLTAAPRLAGAQTSLRRAPQPLLAPVRVLRPKLNVAVQAQTGKRQEQGALEPKFSRRREHIAGRVAALGFACSLAGELITGLGPVAQLQLETGLPRALLYVIVAGFVLQGVLSTRNDSPTWSDANQRDVKRRDITVNPFKNPRKFFAQNEILIGRVAMLGFLGACLLEYYWGGDAPLGHLGLIPTGIPLTQAPWWSLGLIGVFLANGLGVFGSIADFEQEDSAF